MSYPIVIPQEDSPHDMNCDYQVKESLGVWKCLSSQEYQEQQTLQHQRSIENWNQLKQIWYVPVITILVMIYLVIKIND